MKVKYKGKKSRSFGYFLVISSLVILFVSIGLPYIVSGSINSVEWLIIGLVDIPVLGIFSWCWIATYYLIVNDILIAKCGPFTWRVPIMEISKIRLNQKTIGGTWKLTMSWNCIEIEYKNYKSIYISPERQDVFVRQLKLINGEIVVVDR